MENKNKIILKSLGYVLVFLILVSGIFGIGVYYGYSHRPEVDKVSALTNKEPQIETETDFGTFWKVWNILNEKSIYAKKFIIHYL